MEIGIAILLFVCMTALLYVLLSLKITRQVDLQIKEFYKTRIHADMQEFYREMEGYAALFENRIQRFRVLVDRNEAILREADKVSQPVQDVVVPEEPEPFVAKPSRNGHKQQKAKKNLKTKPVPKAKAVQKKVPDVPPVKAMPPKKEMAPRFEIREIERPVVREPAEGYNDSDSAIAEELMKDLFQKDEMELTVKKAPAPAPVKAVEQAPAESPGMANFFSRLGRAIEPVIFGEKPAASQPKEPQNAIQTAPAPAAPKPAPVSGFSQEQPGSAALAAARVALKPETSVSSDFGEVLRRAELIKAEKQAARERAEVEAKAEFYAGGDTFQSAKTAVAAQNVAARVEPATEPRRNALVVKELDQHTVSFLIDSLVKDNGYRRQALRALTENNIPLSEIARLSKIDIGELELMRQLGRF